MEGLRRKEALNSIFLKFRLCQRRDMVQSPCLEGFLYLVVKGKTDKSVHTQSSPKNRTIEPIHTWEIEDAARKALCGRKRRENMMQAGDAGLENRRCSAKSFKSAEFPRGGWHCPFGTSAAEISQLRSGQSQAWDLDLTFC